MPFGLLLSSNNVLLRRVAQDAGWQRLRRQTSAQPVHSGNSPFKGLWDVNLLIQEVKENLDTQVIDIPVISKGSNNYVSYCFKYS